MKSEELSVPCNGYALAIAVVSGSVAGTLAFMLAIILITGITRNDFPPASGALDGLVMILLVCFYTVPFTAIFGIPTFSFFKNRFKDRIWLYGLTGGLISGWLFASFSLVALNPFIFLIAFAVGFAWGASNGFFTALIYFYIKDCSRD